MIEINGSNCLVVLTLNGGLDDNQLESIRDVEYEGFETSEIGVIFFSYGSVFYERFIDECVIICWEYGPEGYSCSDLLDTDWKLSSKCIKSTRIKVCGGLQYLHNAFFSTSHFINHEEIDEYATLNMEGDEWLLTQYLHEEEELCLVIYTIKPRVVEK